jgi:hypothetical protein
MVRPRPKAISRRRGDVGSKENAKESGTLNAFIVVYVRVYVLR